MADLTLFFTQTEKQPFIWGHSDCTLWAADWCKIRFGFDPAEGLRDTYHSEEQADALFDGNYVELVSQRLDHRLNRKSAAAAGDLGIVLLRNKPMAAISTGHHWSIKTIRAIAHLSLEPIRIWGE